MRAELTAILQGPFLLIDIGNYGHEYEKVPLPPALALIAAECDGRGDRRYPKNLDLPPPHYHVPADMNGILNNKVDELRLNGFAYWAQNLRTLTGPHGCVNAGRRELVALARQAEPLWVVLATKQKTSSPIGSTKQGSTFERWTPEGNFAVHAPTGAINTDVVYTEKGKETLVFDTLQPVESHPLDTHDYHVYCTANGDMARPQQYRGKRLPYRSSQFGTASLLVQGKPDRTDSKPLERTAIRRIVAIATLHPHVCGRVTE
jgi:hypothetical protein